MSQNPTAAPALDDLRIEDIDRPAPGSAQFTWCIVQINACADH
ncbi:MAG: hypothetical protein ABIS86_10865 [Streptosporangiaceae bacterium]